MGDGRSSTYTLRVVNLRDCLCAWLRTSWLGRGFRRRENRAVTCHSQGVSPSLSWPSPATGAELDPDHPSRQEVVLIRLHLCLWVGASVGP